MGLEIINKRNEEDAYLFKRSIRNYWMQLLLLRIKMKNYMTLSPQSQIIMM